MVYLGSGNPTRVLTLSSGLSLFRNRLRIASQFDYRGGYTAYDVIGSTGATSFPSTRAVNDPTAPLADQAAAVAIRNASLGGTWAGFMKDGSYLRWRELSATYTPPMTLAHTLGARSATLTLAVRNLGLWSKSGFVDPEANGIPGYFLDVTALLAAAPLTRYWILRLNLGF
jgi:hypothetical protein